MIAIGPSPFRSPWRLPERLDPFAERDLGLGLRLGPVVAVAAREEGLAESRERALPLDEVGGVCRSSRSASSGAHPRGAASAPVRRALPPWPRALPRLELRDRGLARCELLLPRVELGLLLAKLCLRLRDLGTGGVELRGLSVELGLSRPEIRLAASERGALGIEPRRALFELGLPPVQPRLTTGELGLLALVLSLGELSLGAPRSASRRCWRFRASSLRAIRRTRASRRSSRSASLRSRSAIWRAASRSLCLASARSSSATSRARLARSKAS